MLNASRNFEGQLSILKNRCVIVSCFSNEGKSLDSRYSVLSLLVVESQCNNYCSLYDENEIFILTVEYDNVHSINYCDMSEQLEIKLKNKDLIFIDIV